VSSRAEHSATVASSPIRVLFICTGNSARSQMAEALLRRAGGDRFVVASAGTEPRAVHPLAIRALADVGLDISAARSKSLTEFVDQPFDAVVTVCDRARESCPVFPGAARTLHWSLDDPAEAIGTDEERLEVFRATRSEIERRIRRFVAATRSTRAPAPAATR
jgi:arsenate reductase